MDLAVGSVSALEQTMSGALEPVVAEARMAVQQAAVANMDETGWPRVRPRGRKRAWVWTVVSAAATVFHIDPSRGGAVARMLLGPSWAGAVGTDRGTMYHWLAAEQRQVCWAHLKRDFQKLVDWGAPARPTGQRLLAITATLFTAWHRFRAGEIDRPALHEALAPLQAEMAQVPRVRPRQAIAGPDAKAAGVCWELRKLWPALWTFTVVAGIEPTNNVAERSLRPAVLWRKGSFGTNSAAGSRFVERMLTVTATCRQQGRPVLDVLTTALTAARCGAPPPSLLPTHLG